MDSIMAPDGSYMEGEEEHALLLHKTHFPGSETHYEANPAMEHTNNTHKYDRDIAEKNFRKQQLKWAIKPSSPTNHQE